MAQSVPPGDIQAQSNAKIVFNASYDDKHHIKVINLSARRIGWRLSSHRERPQMSSPDGLSEFSLEQLRELRLVIREELEEMEKTVKEAKKECERCEKDYNGELHNGLRSRLGCSPIEDLQIKKRIEKKEEKYEKTRAALFETELLLEGHQKDYEHVKELIKHKKIIIESTGEKDNVPDKAKTTVRSKRDADSKVTKSAAKQLEDDYPVFSIPKESRQEAASSPSKSLKHPERREKSRFSQNTSCHREIVSSSLKSPKDQDLKEQEQKEKHRSSRVDSSVSMRRQEYELQKLNHLQ
ncbi:Protein CBG10225 [Caenorhabditis briggsae]|uniref:Protein CBG10225 n=1 Tax=Caenorhabditis briggsae TaxID=6238 RepID=A8XAT5_CAEBR|nr:Protein CBG10225 [Caenorhabditis briggsae]CAP29750.2 Protein CBG10225 [Caenorhabditis briggsae]